MPENASDVWPPPPSNTVGGPAGSAGPALKPTRSLARWVVALLGLTIIIDLCALLVDSLHLGDEGRSDALLTMLHGLLYITTGVVFFVWTYRSYQNLTAFGTRGLKMTPGSAIGYFFMPVLNLVRPYEAFKELWKASAPALPEDSPWAWTSVRTPPVLLAWWLLWLLNAMLGNIAFLNSRDPAQAGNQAGLWESKDVVDMAAAVCAVLVVRGITARQYAKRQALNTAVG